MPKKSTKTVVKSASLEKVIDNSLAALVTANADGEKAVAALSKTAKSLLAESKRLSKKRATLSRRKKTATARLKRTGDAETRKLLRTTEKELISIKKLAAKTTLVKSANAEELSNLKTQTKRTKAYLTALDKTNRILNKPVKKRRKKRV